MSIIKKLLAFLIGLLTFHVHAQDIIFEHYNDKNGLSHNSVRHLIQDSSGFLWIGTFSGLNRFDGFQFKTYLSSATGINNDDITALELDKRSNNLWIGTRNGLTLFETDTQTFTTFLPNKEDGTGLPEEEIRSVYVDNFDRVWVGTKTKGLYLFYQKEKRFERIPLEGFNYIKEIFEDQSGNIWIGSYKTGSVAKILLDDNGKIYATKKYTLSARSSEEVNPYINFIYEDSNADIFVGTREGLYIFNREDEKFKIIPVQDKALRDILGPYFLSIARGPKGKYWLGTLGGLIVCDQIKDIGEGKFKRFYSKLSDNTSLVDNLVSALFFDPSGVLWIGTEDGLDKYDPYENQFHLSKDISKYIGNQLPRIRGFSKTHDNRIVVATRHNGLFISKGEDFIPLYKTPIDIASIYSEDGEIFYCGLWNGGLLVYDYKSNTSEVIDVGFVKSPIFAFSSFGKNRIILGSFGEGAVLLNTSSLQLEPSFGRILKNSQINTIVRDSERNLWFATEIGVKKYNQKTQKVKTYLENNETGLLHYNISDIVIDKNDTIWIATRNGLGKYIKALDAFMPLENPQELIGKWVINMVKGSNGNLWLNMNNNNVARLRLDSNSFNIYHVNSGNRLDVFSTNGFFNSQYSGIYLGGKKGIINFSPHSINENTWSPRPFITEFRIQNKEILPGVEVGNQVPLEVDINKEKSIHLDYGNRNFSLQFSSPSFTNEKLNKYQYMLEGFDEGWILVNSNSRTVQYTNLFPGNYTFKLKSSNSHGFWSEESSYHIKVHPPFWFTLPALAAYLAIAILSFYFIKKELRNRLQLKQELLTEKVNREREIKLNNEKLRFFTNISHELRTPLTLILGPAKQLLDEKENSTGYQKSRFNLIYQNAKRLLNLVNQVLEFRKAQTGELSLKVSKTNILAYTRSTFESFREFANNKHIEFNFNSPNEEIVGWIDQDKYDKILYNLLSNALKFTERYGHVDVFIQVKGEGKEQLYLEVSDDGIGIPLKSQEKIFTRFYQATNSIENNTGSGIGLALVKSLVELHKGSIEVKSKPQKGSVFTVILPLESSAYAQAEIFDFQLNNSISTIPKVKKVSQNTDILEKIVVIEDHAELRSYLVDYLSEYYKVYEAENGKEGLLLCKKVKPILCVADIMMPVMDGLEFCKQLKNSEFISHIPVVLLTALNENEDKVKGYDVGADGYLAKPFEPNLLSTVISNIIKTRLELKLKFSGEVESEVSLLTHSPLDEDFMTRITQLINDHIDHKSLSSSFLCTELGMSSSLLYRKTKELTDLAPNEFIRTVRLKKSATLLKTKRYNVSEVTSLVGFNDPLYFSRCFKKQFGFPPSKLLK